MTICQLIKKRTDFIQVKNCPIGFGRCRQCKHMVSIKPEVTEVAKYKKLRKNIISKNR